MKQCIDEWYQEECLLREYNSRFIQYRILPHYTSLVTNPLSKQPYCFCSVGMVMQDSAWCCNKYVHMHLFPYFVCHCQPYILLISMKTFLLLVCVFFNNSIKFLRRFAWVLQLWPDGFLPAKIIWPCETNTSIGAAILFSCHPYVGTHYRSSLIIIYKQSSKKEEKFEEANKM